MTDQQETTTISVSEYESAGSLSNGLVKNVKIAPRSVERFEKTADSISLNSASFKIPISDNLLLSRRIILEMPITLNATGANLRHFWASPRADALNRIITNCNVKINGSSVVSQPASFCEITQWFSRESQHLHHGSVLAESPNTCDMAFGNDIPAYTVVADANVSLPIPDLNDDLAQYHFRTSNYDKGFPSRASMPFSKVGTTTSVTGGTGNTTLTFVLRYALKNPVFSLSPYEVLSNISDLEVNLQFNSSQFLNKLFFHQRIVRQSAAGPPPVLTEVVPTASISTTSSEVKLIGYTINPSMPDLIPMTSLVPAQEFITYEYPVGAVNHNDPINVLHSSIHTSQVPAMIFISCGVQDSSLSSKMSDYYAQIRDLTLQCNGRTYSYNLWRPFDFYELNTKNGYKQMYKTFNSAVSTGSFNDGVIRNGVGAPLCFTCNDIGGELKSGVNEPFKLEVRYSSTNLTGVTLNFVSRVHLVMDQTLIIQKGSPVRVLNGISPEEYNQAVSEGRFVSIGGDSENETEELLGGASSISNMFRDAGRFLIRSLNVGNQLLQSAAQVYPETGLGRAAYETGRANQVAQNMNSQLGLGAGMMGGSRLDMLRASGVLR